MATTRTALTDADIRTLVKGATDDDRATAAHKLCRAMDGEALSGEEREKAQEILRIMAETGKPLSELKRCLSKYPQAQRNLKVREKRPLEQLPHILAMVKAAEDSLNGAGRVLLRYSGTEPKIRLLIEGRDGAQINAQADGIAEAILKEIGV